MTITSPSLRRRGLALLGASGAVAALALPALAGAAPAALDPALTDTGIPAGVLEHGVVAFDLTGVPKPSHGTTEYWATSSSWRSVSRDASGALSAQGVSSPSGSVVFNAKERISFRSDGPSTPPFAGWSPAYNKKLVAGGLLQPIGPQTVAGIAGTKYTVPDGKKSNDPSTGADHWVTDNTAAQTTIVLEDGTYAPLVRESTSDNGSYGTFDQRETLQSREHTPLTSATATAARVSKPALAKLLTRWERQSKASAKRQAAHR
ncbi:hypothetical protein [Baekduia alba]|uniref:hypothetical protein n=1 Tax=Baekduia alba TaxID=2997333 RepID=UPI002341F720|nr:hypothetical protein [Baekduia alba]